MNSTSYTYQPLLPGANCIRLLRLLPGEPAEKLQCELFNYQIRNNQTSCLYEALSYVWGDPTEKNDICIDSKQFAITSNLAAAFYRLRDPSLPRLLWVDAICINQADLEERENQVQFMSVIYSCASRVVVWLGEGCPQSNQACRLIIEAADASQRAEETTRPGEENAIIALLRRPWFYRVWVLQEVAMARFTLLLCGDFQMTAHEFSSGLRQFRHEYDQEKTIVSTIESVVYLLEWQPRGGNLGSKLLPLSELIDIFHHRQATDIRDKVYALYGMSTDMMDTRSLQVNYQKPWSTLFKDLAQYSFGEKVHVTI
ncbi:HET-domain-containing protein, partial [Aaosphaeria arxii CBS 175.79]